MKQQMFDAVKPDMGKPVNSFNLFRRTAKLRQFLEVLLLLGLFSWSTASLRTAAANIVDVSSYLFNHHVIFIIGNSIIVLLFLRCHQNNDALVLSASAGDLYNDYVKHSACFDLPSPTEEKDKKIVEITVETPQCDHVAAAIEKARRQIKRFERTQSEKLKRQIRASAPQRQKSVSCGEEIEKLSSEEFRRTVDAFIDQHWCRRKTKQNQFDEYQKYQLLKMPS